MDPQANLTSGVGLKGQSAAAGTVYHALTSDVEDPAAFVLPTPVELLSLMPADRNLTGPKSSWCRCPTANGGCARCSTRSASASTTSSSTRRRRSAC